jgi:lysophospholipase L1-like esterase
MRSRLTMMFMLVALVSMLGVAPAVAAKPAAPPGLPVQLSLGDSWGSGVGAPAGEGYVDQLHDQLRDRLDCRPARSANARPGCKNLELVNLSVGGATTVTLIRDQLPEATELLRARNSDRNPRNDVEVVTLHIGGNDVTGPIIDACVTPPLGDCQGTITASFSAYAVNLDRILSELRTAAGPETPIVLGTYDNPIPACVLASPQNNALGEQVLTQLHALMGSIAAQYGVLIADVQGDLDPGRDWVGGNDCLHPVASGYTLVADAFLEALGLD